MNFAKEEFIGRISLFPFKDVPVDSNVVIYGAGKIGKNYVNQILDSGFCKINYILDQNKCGEKYRGINIFSPEKIINDNNSYVIIAIVSDSIVSLVKQKLISYGVSENRIICEQMKYTYIQLMGRTIKRNYVKDKVTVNKYTKLWEKLSLMSVDGYNLTRVGRNNDGGYVMLQDFSGEKIAYSFGISNDVSWDEDMSNLGYDIYMYDHTIEKLPFERKEFYWKKIGISSSEFNSNELWSLEKCLDYNNHNKKKGMILKIDVEGAERGALINMKNNILERFDQIVIEIHDLLDVSFYDDIMVMLNRLNLTHQVIHIHPNNYGDVAYGENQVFPNVIEATYVKKNKYKFKEYEYSLAEALDMPCNPYIEEINIIK